MTAQGIEAQRAATLGAVYESPVAASDAPTLGLIDRIISDQETRHAWLFRAGAQARKFNEESRIENEEYERER